VVLPHVLVPYSSLAPRHELDVAPDAARDELRPPVPPEVAGLLPDPSTAVELVISHAPGRQRPLPVALPDVAHGRCEGDIDLIAAGTKERLHVEGPGSEHVVRLGQAPAVDSDGGQRVESVAHETHDLVLQESPGNGNRTAVDPVGFPDPQNAVFVVPVERIFDAARGKQIGVD